MIDQQGRVVVMDFGLARSIASDGMTRTGLMVGTMEYMSPEQAQAKELDARSDIFTVGLILYELLSGKMPYAADSAVASLVKRTQERAAPVSDHDAAIPRALSSIVAKCLERDPSARYQSATQVLADLQHWQGKAAAATLRFPDVRPWGRDVPWQWIGALTIVLVLALTGITFRKKLFPPRTASVATGPAVSLAILPFRNASAQPDLDWLGSSLADMLSSDVGQSAHLRTVSPDRLHQVLKDLQISSNVAVDPTMLSRIAQFSNADTIVWGQYAKFGDQIRIDATLQDLRHDRRVPLKIDVPSEKDIPAGVDRLAESIRQGLGVSEDTLKELRASSFQPTSKSIGALRDYDEGLKALREGKNVEAQKKLQTATTEDPTFALAFAKLSQSYANLGYDGQAQQSANRAVALSEDLPQTQHFLITAIRAQVGHNFPDAISAYETLAKSSPYDVDVQWALAKLYEDSGDLAKAGDYYKKLLAANPKDVAAMVASGRIAIKNGDPQGSLELLNQAVSLATQLNNDDQRGTSLHLLGVAYRMLDKSDEALRNFQEALAIREKTGDKRGIAYSVNEAAVVEESLGKSASALTHYQQALALRREIGDKRGLVDTLLDLGGFYDTRGDHEQGLKMYKEALQNARDVGNEGLQAICLNNIGSAYFSKGEYEDARTYFEQAVQLREKSNVPQDIVEGVHNLAETSARAGDYNQSVTQYMRALDLRRKMNDTRGAAIESYSIGRLFEYQGRFGAAISSEQDALKAFRDIKDRTFWMSEILGGYAEALILAGRGQEAETYLAEALDLSRELRNDGLVSQTLGYEGDIAYYAGNFAAAESSYLKSVEAASRSKEPDKVLIAKAKLARLQVEQGHGTALAALRSAAREAENRGFAQLSVECTLSLAQGLLKNRDYQNARAELDRALLRSDNFALKPLNARANYLMGLLLVQQGNTAEAKHHFDITRQLLDSMHNQPGAGKILERADFKRIYADVAHQG
jgi:tetratricopeptide (TPR) repeat protein